MVAAGTATHVACPAATERSLPRQFSLSRYRSRVQILVAITIAVTASSVFVFRIKLDAEEEEPPSQERLMQREAQVDFQAGGVLGNHELQGFVSSSSSVGNDIALDSSEPHLNVLPLPQAVQMLGEDSRKQEKREISSPRPGNGPPDAVSPAVSVQARPENISLSRPSPALGAAQGEEELEPSSHRLQLPTAQQVGEKPTKIVPAQSAGGIDAVSLQMPVAACEEGEEKRLLDVEPMISSIQPTYGYLYAKHNVIQIRGRNFGRCETGPYRVIGLVDGVPCLETKWQSEYSALCIAPKISGTRLSITLQRCTCSSGDLRPHEFNSSQALSHPQQQQSSPFQYSFIEYAAKNALHQADDLVIGSRLPFWLDKSQYTKHGESKSQAGNMTEFMIPVWLLDAMPMLHSSSSPAESFAPENSFKSCAIVGHSASLSGAKLGKEIDSYSAVFRYDGGPSTPKYASDVGNRTTFQVLSSIWAEVLLGEFEDGLHVSRWWSDTATVVFWSERSYQQYVKLRKYYPNAPLRFLSPEFVAHFKAIAEAVKVSVQHEIQAPLAWNPTMLSSLWFSIGMALQVCQQIDLFGVHSRWTHYKYYHEEPLSTSEERVAEFERQLVTGLHNNGFLSSRDDIRWTQEQDKMAQMAGSKSTVYSGPKCLSRDCNRRSCSGNGVFNEEKKECSCFQVYEGKDCEFNRLYQHKDSLLRVEEVQFTEPKLLSQSVFKHQDKESGDMLLYLQGPGGGSSGSNADSSSTFSSPSLSPSTAAATEDESVNVYRMENSTFAKFPTSDVPKTYKRCAVVGNSGSLLFHPSSGAHIDSADAIFRFNQAPTKGFTSYVGSRTTIESLNAAWVKTLLESDEDGENTWLWRAADTDLMLFEMVDPIGLNHRTSSQVLARERWWKRSYFKLRHYFPQRRIRVLNPQFVTWAYTLYTTLQERFASQELGSFAGEKPMSGFYVVLYALLTCEQTDLYGFAPYRDEDKFNPLSPRYHYFDSAVPRTGSHSFDLTRYIFQLLEMHLNLTIHD